MRARARYTRFTCCRSASIGTWRLARNARTVPFRSATSVRRVQSYQLYQLYHSFIPSCNHGRPFGKACSPHSRPLRLEPIRAVRTRLSSSFFAPTVHAQVGKMRLECQALILILNLHVIGANSLFYDLATRMTGALSGLYGGSHAAPQPEPQPIHRTDTCTTPLDMISQDEYPSEAHTVTTEDGYILTLYRIPGSPGSTPVYLQHGLLESSADWLIPGKEKSLALILWDQGYDVWLGNARGNTYSKKHKTLSTSDPQFWNFSWDELGLYDLPAVINYISETTKDSLFYIGHSMGASTFSVMATERPDVANKVKAMIALAPATYVYHMKAPIRLIAPFWREFQQLSNLLGINEFFARGNFFNAFANYICKSVMLRNVVCSNSLFLIAGFNPDQLDYSLLPKIWSKFPAGTSTKLFTHWLQQMTINKFRKFDYGVQGNLRVYNSTQPPEYDISKIQVPIAVFWSDNDWLVGEKDVETFYSQVPLKLGMHKIAHDKFNHFDFLWAVDAPDLVYSKILDVMSECTNQIIDESR